MLDVETIIIVSSKEYIDIVLLQNDRKLNKTVGIRIIN